MAILRRGNGICAVLSFLACIQFLAAGGKHSLTSPLALKALHHFVDALKYTTTVASHDMPPECFSQFSIVSMKRIVDAIF